MSVRRITISVPAGVAQRIKKAAADRSVSAWVTSIIEERLDDAELERTWQDFYWSVNPTTANVRRASRLFERLTKPPANRYTA